MIQSQVARSTVDRTAYLMGLLNQRSDLVAPTLAPEAIAALQTTRNAAAARVQELAIPSTRDEEWRFTDLSLLMQVDYVANPQHSVTRSQIQASALSEAAACLVFVNGVYSAEFSLVRNLPAGVFVGNLAQAGAVRSVAGFLGKQLGAEEVFTALNTAGFADGAIVWVPKSQVVEAPIQLLFLSSGASALSQPRCLVVAESSSKLTIVETHTALEETVYFTNSVTEIWVEANAEVNHTRDQRDSPTAFHIGKTAVSQARDSRYTCNAISLGAKLSRHHLEVYQTGTQTETTLNGLTVMNGDQVADTHSTIAFTQPQGTSHQVHKCIVSDRAHGIFNGKIFVPKAAQLTDARQLSRNLLLSPKARVDTKPQLEITADNVKCAHGATVSQLDSDEVFYLQSRGIPESAARKLLTFAFANETLQQIPVMDLQAQLRQAITL